MLVFRKTEIPATITKCSFRRGEQAAMRTLWHDRAIVEQRGGVIAKWQAVSTLTGVMRSKWCSRILTIPRQYGPHTLPLKDIISAVETDLGVSAGKVYVNTNEKDDQGRVVYAEK